MGQHGPKGCQNGAKKCPKCDNFRKMKTSILAAIYYTLATLTPPEAFPKLMRKSDPTKVDQKDTNTHTHSQHSPKIVPKWSAPFSRICSKMGSIFDVDPKMAPRGVRGPQNGPQRPNMTQKCTKMT